jgi:hypothetical protein
VDSRLGLPKNTVLDGSYRIDRIIGSGGFGVTYRAEDINLKTTVALKEYYPGEFGQRDQNLSVRPKSERHKATFDWGRTSFLREAQTLARFRHPGIVRVSRVFEANATAYMVMDFEQGQSFEAWLESLGRQPTQAELDRIAAPLLDALETLHAADLLHRDIAPDNILIRQDGTPVLLDFGAARRAVAEMSHALTGIIKVGYSPHEQYAADGRYQGPWSDLYALGATLYKAVAGKKPEESTLRMSDDRMLPAAEVGKGAFRPGFLAAIDACLAVTAAKRPQSVSALRPMLLSDGPATPQEIKRSAVAATVALPPGQAPAEPRAGSSAWRTPGRWLGIAAALLAVVAGVYGGAEFTRRQAQAPAEVESKRASDADAKRKADAAAAERQAALEAEAKRAEEERRRQAALEEARRKEEDARREAEARRQAEADAKRRAEVEAEAKRRAEQEANAAKRPPEEPAPPVTKAPTQANEPIRIASPSSWDKDCVPDPAPRVTVIGQPKHGLIEFREGTVKPLNILKGNVKCIGTEQRARIVNYIPTTRAADTDQLSLSILSARGNRYVIDCTVRIAERRSECKQRK